MKVMIIYSGEIVEGEERIVERREKQITERYKQKIAIVEFEDLLNEEVVITEITEIVFENGKSARIENVMEKTKEFIAKYIWDEWIQYGNNGDREFELIMDKDDFMDLYYEGTKFTVYYLDSKDSWDKEVVGFAVKNEGGERVFLFKNHWYCDYKFFNSL